LQGLVARESLPIESGSCLIYPAKMVAAYFFNGIGNVLRDHTQVKSRQPVRQVTNTPSYTNGDCRGLEINKIDCSQALRFGQYKPLWLAQSLS